MEELQEGPLKKISKMKLFNVWRCGKKDSVTNFVFNYLKLDKDNSLERKRVIIKIRHFCNALNTRWIQSNRMLDRFMKYNSKWLEGEIDFNQKIPVIVIDPETIKIEPEEIEIKVEVEEPLAKRTRLSKIPEFDTVYTQDPLLDESNIETEGSSSNYVDIKPFVKDSHLNCVDIKPFDEFDVFAQDLAFQLKSSSRSRMEVLRAKEAIDKLLIDLDNGLFG